MIFSLVNWQALDLMLSIKQKQIISSYSTKTIGPANVIFALTEQTKRQGSNKSAYMCSLYKQV